MQCARREEEAHVRIDLPARWFCCNRHTDYSPSLSPTRRSRGHDRQSASRESQETDLLYKNNLIQQFKGPAAKGKPTPVPTAFNFNEDTIENSTVVFQDKIEGVLAAALQTYLRMPKKDALRSSG